MFKWMDRVYVNARKKIFKNLDTGEILNLELQDDPSNIVTESETPLTAHCLNMAQQELLDDICTKVIVTTTEEIPENTDYTIPLKYKVGNNSLEINYMGEKLVKGKHYIEVGEDGATSNTIQFYDWGQSVPIDRTIEFIVRGDYSEQT